jgi:signal peptidase I
MTDSGSTQTKNNPRNAWLAAMLSLACPGLGLVYVGHFALGLAFLFGPWLFGLLVAGVSVWADTGVLAAVVVATLVPAAAHIVQILWAAVLAKRSPADYQLKRYNRTLVYVAYIIMGTCVSGSDVMKAFVVEAFKMSAGSMMPSLLAGDQVLVCKIGERNSYPHRGDVVAFVSPGPRADKYVKRVIGMPGDEIAMREGIITINGKPIEQRSLGTKHFTDRDSSGQWHDVPMALFEEKLDTKSYLVVKDRSAPSESSTFGPVKVLEGQYFVIGDDRDNSIDSRMWGPVPLENHIGRVHSVWFSWGPEGLRSERIGLAP